MAPPTRRQLLGLAGSSSLVGLAGCAQLLDDEVEEPERRPPDWCVEAYDVDVPDEEQTAESIDGIPRDLDELSPRQEVAYQCHPQGFQLCANCRYFITSRTGEPIGACAIVEGRVRSQDWCALYHETERLDERPSADPLGGE